MLILIGILMFGAWGAAHHEMDGQLLKNRVNAVPREFLVDGDPLPAPRFRRFGVQFPVQAPLQQVPPLPRVEAIADAYLRLP
jgi:hypothetical protein